MVETPTTIISAFTEEQTSKLTGVSQRQLNYWSASDFFCPSIKVDAEELSNVRYYSFRDLVCLKVLNALRNDAKIPFQELRRTKQRLAHLGNDLWVRTTLYILGKTVVFHNQETGDREDASGQAVLEIPLKVVTGKMEDAVKAMRAREAESIGKIDTKRRKKNPYIAGTRIPVGIIKDFANAGYRFEQIIEQYPTLTEEDIRAAIEHEEAA